MSFLLSVRVALGVFSIMVGSCANALVSVMHPSSQPALSRRRRCRPTPRAWALSATGFGARIDDSKGSGGKKNLNNKLRSVSSNQRTGAGSKPLRQAALAFDRIRKQGGKDVCRDVYLRSPLDSPTTFWFDGKVACETAVPMASDASSATTTPNPDDDAMFPLFVAACLSQKRIILEYSMQHLRPQNFGGTFASALELWLAPSDSEMDVAQNKVVLLAVRGSAADLPDSFTVDTVGYNPEIYVGDEVTQGGLRVEYDVNGRPTKPVFDVNEAVSNE